MVISEGCLAPSLQTGNECPIEIACIGKLLLRKIPRFSKLPDSLPECLLDRHAASEVDGYQTRKKYSLTIGNIL
jgi:hypothetical protein